MLFLHIFFCLISKIFVKTYG